MAADKNLIAKPETYSTPPSLALFSGFTAAKTGELANFI